MSRFEGLGCLEHVREWTGPIEAKLLDSQSTASDSETLLFRALYPKIRRFAAVCASVDDDPDDLVQEALARALHLGSLDRLDDPLAYLRLCVRVPRTHRGVFGAGEGEFQRLVRGSALGAGARGRVEAGATKIPVAVGVVRLRGGTR